MPADRATMSPSRCGRRDRRLVLAVLAVPVLLAGCGVSAPTVQPTVTVTQTSGSSGSASASQTPAPAARPGIAAVTTAGALVLIDPATGNITRTLVSGGVTGGEIAASPDGSVIYFAQGAGCRPAIEKIPAAGGTPAAVVTGSLPAISPDGTKLAYASEPSPVNQNCFASTSAKVVVRSLQTGAEQVFPLPPSVRTSALPLPVSYLSWAPDGTRLAVSTAAVQDNEGWGLDIVDTRTARYYLPGPGVINVPPTGSPTPRRSYIRQGVFLPDGNLFISRACCGGFPVRNTSRLMWEVTTTGAFVHQVALGYPTLDHTSLAVSSTGRWLLYLAGHDLYVSENGARPSKLASGLIAATWL